MRDSRGAVVLGVFVAGKKVPAIARNRMHQDMKASHDNSPPWNPEKDPLLQSWKVEAPLPPGFQQEVWRRIDAESPPVMRPVLAWIDDRIQKGWGRPAFAVGYLSTLLLLGGLTGWFVGGQKCSGWETQLSSRYLQTVNPYQATPRSHP